MLDLENKWLPFALSSVYSLVTRHAAYLISQLIVTAGLVYSNDISIVLWGGYPVMYFLNAAIWHLESTQEFTSSANYT